MQRTPLVVSALLALAALPLLPAEAANPCPDEPIHSYHLYAPPKNAWKTAYSTDPTWTGTVVVSDSNLADCNPTDGIPGDWDGDYDWGVGGGAFGYGQWAEDADCDYQLNVHGPNVAVNDLVFGSAIWFFVGEDDQSGPIKIQEPVTLEWICLTDGVIDPASDADDCLSILFVGTGRTCGTGGGDGMYWVFFPYMLDCQIDVALPFCRVNPNAATEATLSVGNLATSGTITAF